VLFSQTKTASNIANVSTLTVIAAGAIKLTIANISSVFEFQPAKIVSLDAPE